MATSSTATIEDIPELALLTFFDKLPLTEVLRIDEVCKAWGGRLKTEARLRRKHLIIVEDQTDLILLERANNCVDNISWKLLRLVKCDEGEEDEGLPYFKLRARLDRHALFTTKITHELGDRITDLLPNLTVIRIVRFLGSLDELEEIIYLLNRYCHQLVEVTLIYYGYYKPGEEVDRDKHYHFLREFTMLFRALNNLTAIKSLKLHLDAPFTISGYLRFIDLGDLCGRLKTLNLNIGTLVDVPNLLKQFAEPSHHLEELYCVDRIDLDTHLSFGPRVSAAMREVYLEEELSYKMDFADFSRFAQSHANLQELTVHLDDLSIWQLAKALASSCKTLLSLHVWDKEPDEEEGEKAEEMNIENTPWWSVEDQCRPPVLSSVKALHLNIHIASHRIFERMPLELLFPNVQVVSFIPRRDRCVDCAFKVPKLIQNEPAKVQIAYGRLMHTCLRLARAPLAKLPKLSLLQTYTGIWQVGRHRPIQFTRDTLAEETFYHLADTLPSNEHNYECAGHQGGEEDDDDEERPVVDISAFYSEDWLGMGD